MRDARIWIGGITLAALSGLALGCPPSGEQCCESAGSKECEAPACETVAETEVSFGTLAGDDDAHFEWVSKRVGDPDDEERIELKVINKDGEIHVWRNGKELSPDEFKAEGGNIVLLSEDGENAQKHLRVQVMGEPGQDNVFVVSGMDDEDAHFGPVAQHAPVMLGIMMSQPDEAVRTQLGLGDREVIMIDDVLPDLPAAKAGLKKFDVIVAIDGDDEGVTVDRLHDVLMNKKPGDKIKLWVMRGNEKLPVVVKLQAYDAEALGIASTIQELEFDDGDIRGQLSELEEQLKQAGLNREQIEKVQREFERALRSIQESTAMDSGHGTGRLAVPVPGESRMFELQIPDTPGLAAPESLRRQFSMPSRGSGDLERRLDQLERRMDELSDRIDDQMERLITHFEKLTERIEKKLDDH